MKQVLLLGGQASIAEVPAPTVSPKNILVRVRFSCISAGTEAAGMRMSSLPLYRRAMKQPENVRRVMQMIRDEGIGHTIDRVRGKLAFGSATGYSAAGEVVELGSEVAGFRVGDRVACAGAGVANHAEFIDVPVNLAVKVPDGVPLEIASTTTLGAIALQGVRRANPTLGEFFVVIGLGLIGQLCVQMLRASGCRVLGVDVDASRLRLASAGGMEHACDPGKADFVPLAHRLSDGFGADGAIICAAGESDDIVSQAMQCCRRKGRVVLVGDVGLNLKRSDFYQKELDFLISSSYGPGRYDPFYEEAGADYPVPYVRWTENRNMQAYLEMLASYKVRIDTLPTRAFPVESVAEAYASVAGPTRTAMVALLQYPGVSAPKRRITLSRDAPAPRSSVRVTLVGAGGFAQGMHLPNLRKLHGRFRLRGVISRTGANARAVAQQFGADFVSTEFRDALQDVETDLILICTRHHLHASMVLEALRAEKHVMVEKPLALTTEELADIETFFGSEDRRSVPILMTGFNRRFSPAVRRVREWITGRSSPIIVNYRMNAGFIPLTHWVQGPEGGGRNIGEACHIYDLFCFLTQARPIGIKAHGISAQGRQWIATDNFIAIVCFSDGSICSLTYTSLGNKDYPKERMEIYFDGAVIEMDDYRSVRIAGRKGEPWKSASPSKGQLQELEALGEWMADPTSSWPISLDDQLAASRIAIEVDRQLRSEAP